MTPTTLAPGESATLTPPPRRLVTVDEFVRDYTDYTELEDGHVIEVAMPGGKHGRIGIKMAVFLENFASLNRLGRCVTLDTFVVTKSGPDTVRGMDIGYLSFQRLPENVEFEDGPVPVAPELIVEVRSPSDRPGAVTKKVQEYLNIGVIIVAVIDPKAKTVTVHRSPNQKETFDESQTLTFEDVLPGFSVPVKALFE
ncbi:Uma2 family endonuclease [soil metagenome]